MATRTLIEELNVSDPSSVQEWVERFEEMAEMHDVLIATTNEEVKARRKVALLLSLIGPEGYKLIKAYSAPDAPNTKSYADLRKCIIDNLAPKTSAISILRGIQTFPDQARSIRELNAFYVSGKIWSC